MDINIEEIFKMTVFDYKDLDQVDVLKELELYEKIFDEQPKQEKKISHEHPEYKVDKLGRSMRACKHPQLSDAESAGSRRRSVDVTEISVNSPRNSVKSAKSVSSVYKSELDKIIKENKDSYFLKLLMQDNDLTKVSNE